jgi:hypothetical protein
MYCTWPYQRWSLAQSGAEEVCEEPRGEAAEEAAGEQHGAGAGSLLLLKLRKCCGSEQRKPVEMSCD